MAYVQKKIFSCECTLCLTSKPASRAHIHTHIIFKNSFYEHLGQIIPEIKIFFGARKTVDTSTLTA